MKVSTLRYTDLINCYFSSADIGEIIGKPRWHVQNLERQGAIQGHRQNGRVTYRLGDVLAYEAARDLRLSRKACDFHHSNLGHFIKPQVALS
jgi:hypothetical protein